MADHGQDLMMRRRRLWRLARGDTKGVPPSHVHLQAVGEPSRPARQQRGGGATWGVPAAQPTHGRGASCDGQSRGRRKLNRFAPPPWATGNRWSIWSRWEEVQRRPVSGSR